MSGAEKQQERELKFYQVIDLLREIYKHKNPRKIEINFDGYMFKSWNVSIWNPTADDFHLKHPEEEPQQESVDIPTKPKMIHRK